MDIELTAEHLGHRMCRICLQQDNLLNVQKYQVQIQQEPGTDGRLDMKMCDVTVVEIMQIFHRWEEKVWDLSDELHVVCKECLDELVLTYLFYMKLERANQQIRRLYKTAQSLEQKRAEERGDEGDFVERRERDRGSMMNEGIYDPMENEIEDDLMDNERREDHMENESEQGMENAIKEELVANEEMATLVDTTEKAHFVEQDLEEDLVEKLASIDDSLSMQDIIDEDHTDAYENFMPHSPTVDIIDDPQYGDEFAADSLPQVDNTVLEEATHEISSQEPPICDDDGEDFVQLLNTVRSSDQPLLEPLGAAKMPARLTKKPKKRSRGPQSGGKAARLDEASIVIGQFIPSSTEYTTEFGATDMEESGVETQMHTLDFAAIKIKGSHVNVLKNNDCIEVSTPTAASAAARPSAENTESIYMCKYCPNAYTAANYLIAHTRKCHVCNHCLQAFKKETDLQTHLKTHNSHKCKICEKPFSSHSNLRAHMKRIHGLALPAQVSLMEYKGGGGQTEEESHGQADEPLVDVGGGTLEPYASPDAFNDGDAFADSIIECDPQFFEA